MGGPLSWGAGEGRPSARHMTRPAALCRHEKDGGAGALAHIERARGLWRGGGLIDTFTFPSRFSDFS